MLTNPKIVDMKPREEGPNMIADIHKYVKNGKSRLYKIQDVVKEIKHCAGATLLLPEFQNRFLTTAETDAIKSFVMAGGSAIFADDANDRISPVVKRAFGMSWQSGSKGRATKSTKSARFANCPSHLDGLNGGVGMRTSSMKGGNFLYSMNGGKDTMVAAPQGQGPTLVPWL